MRVGVGWGDGGAVFVQILLRWHSGSGALPAPVCMGHVSGCWLAVVELTPFMARQLQAGHAVLADNPLSWHPRTHLSGCRCRVCCQAAQVPLQRPPPLLHKALARTLPLHCVLLRPWWQEVAAQAHLRMVHACLFFDWWNTHGAGRGGWWAERVPPHQLPTTNYRYTLRRAFRTLRQSERATKSLKRRRTVSTCPACCAHGPCGPPGGAGPTRVVTR